MIVGSKTSATSKTEILVTIVKEWKLSKIFTNSSILDVAMALRSYLSRLVIGIVISHDN